MLRVVKLATLLSVACVTAASAAPAGSGLQQGKPTAGTTVELARATRCHSHSCGASRRKARRNVEASHRAKRRSHASRHRSRGHTRSASAGTSRSCLTGAARGLLSRIESHFGSVRIISTCRPGARIAGTGRISRHASGNAVDFDAGGRKSKIVSWLIANHKSGGTMTYPDMSHIHVDIGPHFVSIAGGRHYASWSSRKKTSHHRGHRSARVATDGREPIERGASMAQARFDSDGDD
ncbi:MAG: hypothetical protein AB7L90_12615 [Hyphomicrobiaceae bacterium]